MGLARRGLLKNGRRRRGLRSGRTVSGGRSSAATSRYSRPCRPRRAATATYPRPCTVPYYRDRPVRRPPQRARASEQTTSASPSRTTTSVCQARPHASEWPAPAGWNRELAQSLGAASAVQSRCPPLLGTTPVSHLLGRANPPPALALIGRGPRGSAPCGFPVPRRGSGLVRCGWAAATG